MFSKRILQNGLTYALSTLTKNFSLPGFSAKNSDLQLPKKAILWKSGFGFSKVHSKVLSFGVILSRLFRQAWQ